MQPDSPAQRLMLACASGKSVNLEIQGAQTTDINKQHHDKKKYTPLLVACRYRSAHVVQQLVHRGATFTRNKNGITALHQAAANPDPMVLEILLQAGLHPYLRDDQGRCPLAAALLARNSATALALLNAPRQNWLRSHRTRHIAQSKPCQSSDAQYSRVDDVEDDTLDVIVHWIAVSACSRGWKSRGHGDDDADFVCSPRERFLSEDMWIHCSLSSFSQASKRTYAAVRRYKMSRWLSPASLNTPIRLSSRCDSSFTTLLHLACACGFVGVACALLEHGANPEILDGCGRRALDVCVSKRQFEALHFLLCFARGHKPTQRGW